MAAKERKKKELKELQEPDAFGYPLSLFTEADRLAL